MADAAAARREARRQKILRNSENRLNRLLGNPGASEEDLSLENQATIDTTPASTDTQTQPSFKDLASASSATATSTPDPADPCQSPTPADTEGLRQRLGPLAASTPNQGARQQNVSAQASSHVAKPGKTWNRPGDISGKQESVSGHMEPLKLLDLIRCGGCLLVAFLTRWAITFGIGLLFFEWVMIPFLVLEASLFYFQTTHMKDLKLPHQSSMMSYVLVLSGVKQDIVAKYNGVMGYITAATEDFALFLFAFLLCHAVMA